MRISGIGDVAFAGVVASIVALLVVPLPTPALDLLLTANIAFAVVLLLSAIYVRSPLQFSTFPSMLLVATLVRLALNVSSTRLILGQADAGQVIAAFGEFVVGGNYVVGAVVFLILTVIQFLVIAKGSERVAEVAARFTLDAMPGKQMSIDADLRAGAFTLDEARRRRSELQRESQLFGAMDGAMKFVKGDAIAGIVITVVNVCGGLLIGIAQRGMSAVDAAETYTLLTIGDGLVSQIPALIVSIAAGLIVTRVASAEEGGVDLGTEMLSQLGTTPKVFGVASGLLAGLGVVPGLPTVPFVGLALVAAALAWWLRERSRRAAREADALSEAPARSAAPLVPSVPALTVEVGSALGERLRAQRGEEGLRDELQELREGIFQRLGVKLPATRVRFDGHGLAPDALRIAVYDVPELTVQIAIERSLVLAAPDVVGRHASDVAAAVHPVTGGVASSVPSSSAEAVVAAGLTTLDLAQQVMLWAAACVRRHAERFVGLAEVQASLDQLEPTHGALIDAVTPRPVPLATLTAVLKRLVGEGVSIRDLRAVLEALAAEATEEHDVVELTEMARCGLGPSIVHRVAPSRVLDAWLVDHAIEDVVRGAVRRDGATPSLALAPRVTVEILDAFRGPLEEAPDAVIVASQDVRRYLRQVLHLEFPSAVVLGLQEIREGARLETRGTVSVGRRPSP